MTFFDGIVRGRYNHEIGKGWIGRIDRTLMFCGEMINQFDIAIATSDEAQPVF